MTGLARGLSKAASATRATIRNRQRWVAGGLAFALFLGLAWLAPWKQGVQLLTGDGSMGGHALGYGSGCYTDWAEGPLVIDANAGTAILDNDLHATVPAPIMWRPGYSARQVGSEVEVLDPSGDVVAITGRSYRIEGGYVGADRVFFACGFVTPQ
jgi:hypothetical protein